MPILEIFALPQHSGINPQAAMKKTCVALAEIYGCAPEQMWATWQTLDPENYVEGETAASEQPEGTHPPIVHLYCFKGKPQEVIDKMLTTGSEVLSRELGIPGNVFMVYNEIQSGRVYTGGAVRY